MSSFLELQNEVLAHGFDAQVFRPQIKKSLNDALARMLGHVDAVEHELESALVTVAGVQTVTIPAAAQRIESLRDTTIDPNLTLQPVSIQEMDEYGEDVGRPRVYAIFGTTFGLWPIPDGIYDLSLRYWSQSIELVDDDDVPAIPVQFHDLLVSWAASRAYKREDDFEASAFHKQEFLDGVGNMAADVQFRNKERRQVGGMLDVWAGYE